MNWTLEVVCVPVDDVDRAKAFYADRVGFHVDFDSAFSPTSRVVQLTPPGSGCSIQLGTGAGAGDMTPGSLRGRQLVVPDVRRARAELADRGIDVSPVQVYAPEGVRPARHDETGTALDNVGFASFADLDGNEWAVQQISSRA